MRARYESLLSALPDGEATPEQLAILRPHMRTCLSCRARLREFRAAPGRVAALVPPAALVAADGDGPLRSMLESAIAAAQHKAAGQKLAAVAASAAALAGGGTAIDEFANHRGPPPTEPVQRVHAEHVKDDPGWSRGLRLPRRRRSSLRSLPSLHPRPHRNPRLRRRIPPPSSRRPAAPSPRQPLRSRRRQSPLVRQRRPAKWAAAPAR